MKKCKCELKNEKWRWQLKKNGNENRKRKTKKKTTVSLIKLNFGSRILNVCEISENNDFIVFYHVASFKNEKYKVLTI